MLLSQEKKLKFHLKSKDFRVKQGSLNRWVIFDIRNLFFVRGGFLFCLLKPLQRIFIFLLLLLWIFGGSQFFSWQPKRLGMVNVNKVKAQAAPLQIGKRTINFNFTDDNTDENLIIKTNQRTYIGLGQADIYLSVTNIGQQTEAVNLQAYFPQDKGKVEAIERYQKDVAYEVEVPDYGARTYLCQSGWSVFTQTPLGEDTWIGYLCEDNSQIKNCDSLSDDHQACTLNKIEIGSHQEIRHKDVWRKIALSTQPLVVKQSFLKRLFGAGSINRKKIPVNFKVKGSTRQPVYQIGPGETQYFKMKIVFPPQSAGEFYIEAIGDKNGYGLLDPWWNSSWNYRMPITVDNRNNSNSLTDYQLYIELTSSQSSFWNHVKSDGGDVRFIAADDSTELDYWKQYWDYSGQTASFWVQVDSISASATSTIYMYYGNGGANSTSDENATFSYNTMQDLFYVVKSSLSGISVKVVSLVDNNQVQLDSQTAVNLNKQEMTTFSSPSATSVLRAKGPVHAKLIGGADYDALVPISFAATQFVVPSTRNSENFYIYAPFANSVVTIYDGTTQEQQQTVNQGAVWTIQDPIGIMAIVEGTQPVLLFFDNSGPYDAMVIYPTTARDLYGIRSNGNYIGVATNSTNFSIGCSGGNSTSVTNRSRGTRYTNSTCSSGAEGAGNAVRLYSINNGIGAIQQADSDGGESTSFLPPKEFGTEYMVPTNAAYLAVACAPDQGTVHLSVYDESNNFVTSGTCAGSGNNPGKAYFGAADATTYNAGSRIVSTDSPAKPFYVYYEDTTATGAGGGDENNLWGAPQSRKYSVPNPSYSFGSEEFSPEPVLTQNYYRWYENVDGVTPSTAWASLAENSAIDTTNTPPSTNSILRLRISVQVSNANLSASVQAFKLQYGQGSDCSTVSSWIDVDALGGSGIWRGYNNSTAADGTTLSSTLLSVSDVAGSYEEANNSVSNPNAINIGQDAEWDWVIQNNGAAANTEYCFRMVKSDGSPLNSYNNLPKLITNTPPLAPTQTKLFDNEKTNDTTPLFEFSTSDSSNDDIIYQIEWDTDYNFGSATSRSSDTDNGFSNITTPADTSPFNSGDNIRFIMQSADALADNTTYWWRVRAKDPNGSNSWGDWSTKRSFTIDSTVNTSTWFQTLDEQFNTDTYDNTTINGSDSVKVQTIIGQYDTTTLTNESYSTVNLNNYYNNLIVVASPRYSGSSALARSVRIKNKTHTSFQIKVDAYDGALSENTVVDWIAMESGAWTMEDGGSGLKIIAGTKLVSALGGSSNWDASEVISFSPTFSSTPIVLHTVTSDSDSSWITSHVDNGSSYGGDPTASQMGLILNFSKTPNSSHGSEYIDYLAADTGSGTNNGITFDIVKSSDSIEGYLNSPPYNVSYGGVFSSAPEVSVIAQLGEDGGDGGWAITYGTPIQTDHPAAIDEMNSTTDRQHTTEPAGLIAFDAGGAGSIKQYNGTSGSLTSTAIDFDDGNGSAWGQISWHDDETNGDIKYQVEYYNGSSWGLVPDGDLSGNSNGFDSSPVDISALNTATYNQIRLKANFTYTGGSPFLQDWTVSWTASSGSLSVDIVDSGGSSVSSPSMAMGSVFFSFNYQTANGNLGVNDQRIRINNSTSNEQWSLTIAATNGTTAYWDSAGTDYDFNDPTANAGDGADSDSLGGQMTINPSNATITPQAGCNNNGLTLGSANSFAEDSTDSITLLTAGVAANTNCYWDLTGVTVSQTIPAEQPVATDYSIDMTLTVTAI